MKNEILRWEDSGRRFGYLLHMVLTREYVYTINWIAFAWICTQAIERKKARVCLYVGEGKVENEIEITDEYGKITTQYDDDCIGTSIQLVASHT